VLLLLNFVSSGVGTQLSPGLYISSFISVNYLLHRETTHIYTQDGLFPPNFLNTFTLHHEIMHLILKGNFFLVLGIELGAFHMLSVHSDTELHH
jgi:hypothetical protein